ncbi:MAG: MATE family efflux transporter [Candidatus Coproplasma sp.]
MQTKTTDNQPNNLNIDQSQETQFAKTFTFKRLIKFVLPSVIMMVFTSIYGVIDGIFVSNFAGESAFAAVNLIMPVLMAFATLGFMIGAGGAALVSKILGEGNKDRACGIFSFLIYVTFVLGLVVTAVGIIFMPDLARLMKAEGDTLEKCVLYGRINMAGITLFMLQNVFQSFFPAAEKPKLGLAFIVSAGVTNAVLDAVFLAWFKWGIAGAAAATVTGQAVGGLAPVLYFTIKRDGVLKLGKPIIDFKALGKTCANGSSELMTNVSLSLVNILYNYQLMRLVGESGVSAYGVLMYVNFIFISAFLGYSVGVSPIIGFNYGAGNRGELKNVLKKSLIIIAVTSASMFALAMALSYPLPYIFVGYNEQLLALTRRGFMICSTMFLVLGFNVFGSAFFTALNNGLISAILSFMRTLVLQVVCVLTLPMLWGIDGIWSANVFAEIIAVFITATFIICFRKKYGYL